jgi:hypothetical protein
MSKVEKYFQYVTNYRNKHVEKEISKLNTTKKNSHFLNEIKYSNLQNDEKIRSNTWQNLNRNASLFKNKLPGIRQFRSQQENRPHYSTKRFPVVFKGN